MSKFIKIGQFKRFDLNRVEHYQFGKYSKDMNFLHIYLMERREPIVVRESPEVIREWINKLDELLNISKL